MCVHVCVCVCVCVCVEGSQTLELKMKGKRPPLCVCSCGCACTPVCCDSTLEGSVHVCVCAVTYLLKEVRPLLLFIPASRGGHLVFLPPSFPPVVVLVHLGRRRVRGYFSTQRDDRFKSPNDPRALGCYRLGCGHRGWSPVYRDKISLLSLINSPSGIAICYLF